MEKLNQMKCVPLSATSVALNDQQIHEYKEQIPAWELLSVDGIRRLERTFKFKDFSEALAFTSKVGRIAEEQDHHPSILTVWGKVTVTWWTHKVNGLHQNDFIMAAKTDNLA